MTANTEEAVQEPETEAKAPGDGDTVTINFVEDGMTALGKVWYRGEELTITRGSEDWEKTLSQGDSWVDLDEAAQEARWGRRMFRLGPWTGAKYEISEELSAEEQAKLAKVNAERFGDKPSLPGGSTTSKAPKRRPGRPRKSDTTED